MRARVIEADYANARLKMNIAMLRRPGRQAGLVATGDALERRWRVTYERGNRHEGHWFRLEGGPITEKDFPIAGRMSVWEFGAGDDISLRTGVSVRRADADNVWEVYANTQFTLEIGEARLEWSSDRRTWRAPPDDGLLGPGAGTPLRFWVRHTR